MMNKQRIPATQYALLFMAAGICFFAFSGITPLYDWDEINFAESSREMMVIISKYKLIIAPSGKSHPCFSGCRSSA
jgi:hypothetical protein